MGQVYYRSRKMGDINFMADMPSGAYCVVLQRAFPSKVPWANVYIRRYKEYIPIVQYNIGNYFLMSFVRSLLYSVCVHVQGARARENIVKY
jgi:hypothetical protein